MVHYEGGATVEPGYFFGGVDDIIKSGGNFKAKFPRINNTDYINIINNNEIMIVFCKILIQLYIHLFYHR